MRGDDANSGSLFSYIDLEKRVAADHPLRVIREIATRCCGRAQWSRCRTFSLGFDKAQTW